MVENLPVDLLYAIGDAINSRCTLASLCRVSRAFNRLFTPMLYAKIHVQDCEFQSHLERISKLPFETHLGFTKTLHIGRNIPRLPFLASGVDVDTCLEKMPELVSLEVTTSVGELDLSGEGRNGLESVAKRGKLRDLILVASKRQEFPTFKTVFTNLRTISLQRLSRVDQDRHNDLVEILLASPHLNHLGLSHTNRDEIWSSELHKLCQLYSQKRIERNLPLLRIEELDLGTGYLPKDMRELVANPDYLSQLTDLGCLSSLQLRNHAYFGEERQSIHVPLLHDAMNLKRIEVEVLSKDIQRLLKYLCWINPGGLTSLSFIGLHYPHENDYFSGATVVQDVSSILSPAQQVGHSWWSLSFTETSTAPGTHYMKDFIGHCTDLQYLACPMNNSNLELFKTYMPNMMHLHTLIITKGNFPDHVPTTVNVSTELDARKREREAEDTQSQTQYQPFSAHPEINRVSTDGQRQAKDRAREKGEKIRKGIAEDLFTLSREIYGARKRRYEGEPLKYVGLGYRVYRWVLSGPMAGGADGEMERRVEQLSLDEARTFKEVRRALQVSPDAP
ncbi:hypothetical protein ONS95_001413 [Cadophora gregata]|uniref:uncharacterized protein n=1 Tax=Cadophora gregata TaxID=51156 RepID=UPI0026DCC675|nr:uncharacterized protein ONS95_001413 [Cadophora gregata]KAK0111033.1 hypothetical protein ONS95_001413 [Cadophora gregata]KAK0112506.1 hypothetical protein ONS96_001742 [Cadophora gregata f. sp. sojae]